MPQVADLNDYRRQREADGRAMQVHVEREVDPECANRSRYLIISKNREAVQTVINGLIAEVKSSAPATAISTGLIAERPVFRHRQRRRASR